MQPPYEFKDGSYPGTGGSCGTSISSNCTIVVTFNPTEVGTHNDTIVISYDSTTVSKNITGGKPLICVEHPNYPTDKFDLGIAIYPSQPQTTSVFTTIRNTGGQDATITSVVIVNGSFTVDAFFIDEDNCTGTLAAGDPCTISAYFHITDPEHMGDFNTDIIISYTGGTDLKIRTQASGGSTY